MAKITLPKASCQRGAALDIWYHDLVDFDGTITVSRSNGNVILEGNFDLTISEIEAILLASGSITEMLSAIYVTDWLAFRTVLTPVGISESKNIFNDLQMNFLNWLQDGEVWWKLIGGVRHAIFYTNMNGGAVNDYLTGAEIKALSDLDLTTHKTLAEANILIADSWVKFGG
jgi:hypothetical protein